MTSVQLDTSELVELLKQSADENLTEFHQFEAQKFVYNITLQQTLLHTNVTTRNVTFVYNNKQCVRRVQGVILYTRFHRLFIICADDVAWRRALASTQSALSIVWSKLSSLVKLIDRWTIYTL